jgi:uncharacterized protein (TIGR00730 family)
MGDKVEKAYRNTAFINSPDARVIRILSEYFEPRRRFLAHKVFNTVVFFGSARLRDAVEARENLERARKAAEVRPEDEELAEDLRRITRLHDMARYYEDARELARRMTEWSMSRPRGRRRVLVCTGGGPGIMEAANRGAADVKGGKSLGLGISLPKEEGLNPYVTDGLGFEFHYFFMRKYWFSYLAKGLVTFPGGFGTLDELCELTTLRQTRKMKKHMPTVLFGTDFWNEVLDVRAMVEHATISPGDYDLLYRCDTVDAAFDYLTAEIEADEKDSR